MALTEGGGGDFVLLEGAAPDGDISISTSNLTAPFTFVQRLVSSLSLSALNGANLSSVAWPQRVSTDREEAVSRRGHQQQVLFLIGHTVFSPPQVSVLKERRRPAADNGAPDMS